MAGKFKRKNPVYTNDPDSKKSKHWWDLNSEEMKQKALEEKIRKKLALKNY